MGRGTEAGLAEHYRSAGLPGHWVIRETKLWGSSDVIRINGCWSSPGLSGGELDCHSCLCPGLTRREIDYIAKPTPA